MNSSLDKLECIDKLFARLKWCRWKSRRSIKSKSTLCLDKVQGTGSIKGNISERKSIQSVLEYSSETWAMIVEDMARSERTVRIMVWWLSGIYLNTRTANAELNSSLGIECITDLVR